MLTVAIFADIINKFLFFLVLINSIQFSTNTNYFYKQKKKEWLFKCKHVLGKKVLLYLPII